MSLTDADKEWFKTEVRASTLEGIKEHERTYHGPGQALAKAGRWVGIIAAAVTVTATVLGGLLWLIAHAK